VNDAELVEKARGGDASAFGELVEQHRAAVFRTALAGCGSREDAEEVAQDAFVVAWRTLDRFRGEAQFRTWILAIAWKRSLTRRRSLSRWFHRFRTAADPLFEPVAACTTAEKQLLDRELTDAVARVVPALPARLRDPLLLASTGEWTYDEMSRVLGAPAGTLKWRVNEARRQLKRRLNALGFEVE
jgi:RNA polymerase sigma-70 factor (ECF subfamily)